MKINFEKTITTLDGTVVKDETGKDVTFTKVVINSLLAEERDLSGEEKVKRFKLANKVHSKAEDYSVEELADIKKIAGKVMGTLIVGCLYELIDSPAEELKKVE